MVVLLGDKCAEYGGQVDVEAHIETCSGILWRELEHSGDEILQLVIQCAEELPHKSTLYATLVGLLNLEDEEFGRKVVDTSHAKLQDALDSENCNKIRILMRFITVLMCSNVIPPSSVIEVFETLLSSATTTVDEERGNLAWQARADFYIFCILGCLPWGGLELAERVPDDLDRVMTEIEAYLSIRKHIFEPAFLPFETPADDNKDGGQDFLEDLWERIKLLCEDGWKVDSVPRPHLDFESRLVTGKSYEFRPVTCPEQPDQPSPSSDVMIGRQRHEAELKYPQRIQRLHIFPVSRTEENMKPIDRFVVEEYLLDIMLYLNGCRKQCAAYMASLPVTFRYEYLMAETIFSQLLLLPNPPFKGCYYALVIIDLCKALPGAFPMVVAGAVRSLFDRVNDLDLECQTRLILWLSQHLSNFQFIWQWEEWLHVLDLPRWSPQRVFVQEVLQREVRLSYWEKIMQSIQKAPGLEELLPPKDGSCFKYADQKGDQSEGVEFTLSKELNNLVKDKKTSREILSWVEENIIAVHGHNVSIDVVVQTLLHIGSKSFSHLFTVLERYGNIISKLGSGQSNEILVIEETSKIFQNNTQMAAIAIDRMMVYRIVSNLSIVTWVFSPSNVEQFHTSDRPWEILRNALDKTYNRISDLRKGVISVEKSVQKAIEAKAKAQADLDSAEALLEAAESEELQGQMAVKLKRLKAAVDRTKQEESSEQESLEAKDALLSRALSENEVLFITLYRCFSDALMKHLSVDLTEKQEDVLGTDQREQMSIDSEEPSAMDADDDERRNQRFSKSNGLHSQAEQQWCRCTLGQLRALTRKYATEIWPHIDKIDAEVFTGDIHPSIVKAVYSALRRPV
uniref:Nuclear cap-binding protein subunit 1 n=1 Tax=Juniperus flaccida TaxID=487036 RepID=A0A3Q8BIP6_9CONI|nr:putative ABA hypersensitive 1 [Juniperus flaccida]